MKSIFTTLGTILLLGMLMVGCSGTNTTDTETTRANIAFTSGENNTETASAVDITPKTETSVDVDMADMIVYQGRVYTGSHYMPNWYIEEYYPEWYDPEFSKGESFVGDKLGQTAGASTGGKQDIYSVKGYDTVFRIMTWQYNKSTIYESWDGVNINSGKDVFSLLRLDGRIKKAFVEGYDSWNNGGSKGTKIYTSIKNMKLLNSFINELCNTKPYRTDEYVSIWRNHGDIKQKFIHLFLEDGLILTLTLFKDGYVHYGGCPYFFKMENQLFIEMWENIDYHISDDMTLATTQFLQEKGYTVLEYHGYNQYILDKAKVRDTQYWGAQNIDPEDYIGKEIKIYAFTIKNHPLDNVEQNIKHQTFAYIMVSQDVILGGFTAPENGIIGKFYALDGKSLEEVSGMPFWKWYTKWQ